jgi:hypothetical protein
MPDIEDPRYWPDYYARNQAWTLPGDHSYNTQLSPAQEKEFRSWVSKNQVPFDPSLPVSDYDMRGFWQAKQQGDPLAKSGVDPNDKQMHFPDRWKTPYAATFSAESQWADPKLAPRWEGDRYVLPNGKVLWDDKKQEAAPELWGVTAESGPGEVPPSARFGLKLGEGTEGIVGNALNGLWDFVKSPVAGSEQAAANQLGQPFSEKLARAENIALSFGPQTFAAYHGTPHLFDKFSDKAIGSGEGAQAYGHGHYVAGNPKVAEMYKEVVTSAATGNNILSVITKQHPDLFSRIKAEVGGDPWASWEPRRKLEQLWDAHNYGDPAKVPNLFSPELTRDLIGSGALTSPPGHLLEINVKPDEHELLDWDKSFSQQSPQAQKAIQKLAEAHGYGSDAMKSGSTLYRKLANDLGSKEKASKALHNAGIPGIKYLDQGSRAAGEGTRNYVIFDPKNLEIRARNGVPLVPVDHDPFTREPELAPVEHNPFLGSP